MYIDFEDARPETPTIEPAISLREGVMISVFAHVLLLGLIVLGPKLPFVQSILQRIEQAQQAKQVELQQQLERQRERDDARFVFVQPKLDMQAPKPPPRAELSDKDRMAQSLQKAPNPTNPLPYSRGNTTERIESAEKAPQQARGPEAPQPGQQVQQPPQQQSVAQSAQNQTNGFAFERGSATTAPPRTDASQAVNVPRPQPQGGGSGSLGEALRNLQKYTVNQNFDNPGGGGGQFGPAIQFDTKGVEFGPWIRRFIAQIRRNWFIPYAAMSMRGHCVLQFNVHKDGRITDIAVVGPSDIDAFNNSAFNALQGSNPTQPLPPEYPSDKAFFTVTFYFNEQPQQ